MRVLHLKTIIANDEKSFQFQTGPQTVARFQTYRTIDPSGMRKISRLNEYKSKALEQ